MVVAPHPDSCNYYDPSEASWTTETKSSCTNAKFANVGSVSQGLIQSSFTELGCLKPNSHNY